MNDDFLDALNGDLNRALTKKPPLGANELFEAACSNCPNLINRQLKKHKESFKAHGKILCARCASEERVKKSARTRRMNKLVSILEKIDLLVSDEEVECFLDTGTLKTRCLECPTTLEVKFLRKRMIFLCVDCFSKKKKADAIARNIENNSIAKKAFDCSLEWDHEKNGDLSPETVSVGSRLEIYWKCLDYGHSYKKTPLLRCLNGFGCQFCSGAEILPGFNSLQVLGGSLMEEWDWERNDVSPDEISPKHREPVYWKCKKCCFSWKASVFDRKTTSRKRGECPECKGGFSYLEKVVMKFLVEILEEESLIKMNSYPLTTDKSAKLQIDFYVPSLKIGFEVQDFATHSKNNDNEPLQGQWKKWAEARNYEPVKKGPKYHNLKKRLTNQQLGAVLIDLWEDEILDGTFKCLVAEAIFVKKPTKSPVKTD